MQIRLKIDNKYLQFLLLFGMEFDVPIIGFLTLRKIAFLLLFILFIKTGIRTRILRSVCVAMAVIGLILLYAICVINLRFGGDAQLPYGVYNIKEPIFLFCNMIMFPVFLIRMFGSADEFIHCQWSVLLFQAAITVIGRVILPVRIFIFEHFSYGDGRLYQGVYNGVRSVGVDLSGAVGSMVLFSGIICGIYLYYRTNNIKEKKNIILGWMLIISALLFMGRTGLYFGAVALLLVMIDGIRRLDKAIYYMVFGGVAIMIVVLIYISVAPDSWGLQTWVRWVTEIVDLFGKDKTISAIRNMSIPPLTVETFFGTGLRTGVTESGLVLNHDAGYIQSYTSIGLLGCVLYYSLIYGFYFSMFNKLKNRKTKWIYLLFLIVIAIGEMKEPFLAKSPLTIILSCMFMMELKQGTHDLYSEVRLVEKKEKFHRSI